MINGTHLIALLVGALLAWALEWIHRKHNRIELVARNYLNTLDDAVQIIDLFDRQCERCSYTETGEVWDVLSLVRDAITDNPYHAAPATLQALRKRREETEREELREDRKLREEELAR